MEVLGYILDGLEKWLEVERERGVRTLEVDRSLLSPAKPKPVPAPVPPRPPPPAANPAATAATKPSEPPGTTHDPSGSFDFVFLHDRPLDAAGQDMMSKIVAAMGKTPETAPIVTERPVPTARAYVVLGARALRKFFPAVKAEPGQWIRSPRGKDVLVTYSPAFFLRFPTVTKAVQKMKQEMWTNLKDLMRRLQ